jgi:hypothetical protein
MLVMSFFIQGHEEKPQKTTQIIQKEEENW